MAKNTSNAPETDDADEAEDETGGLKTIKTTRTITQVVDGEEQKEKRSATVQVQAPESVEDATSRFGEETTLRLIRKAWRLKVQQDVSSLLKDGADEARIQSEIGADYVPDFTRVSRGLSDEEKAERALAALDPDVRAALLAKHAA